MIISCKAHHQIVLIADFNSYASRTFENQVRGQLGFLLVPSLFFLSTILSAALSYWTAVYSWTFRKSILDTMDPFSSSGNLKVISRCTMQLWMLAAIFVWLSGPALMSIPISTIDSYMSSIAKQHYLGSSRACASPIATSCTKYYVQTQSPSIHWFKILSETIPKYVCSKRQCFLISSERY